LLNGQNEVCFSSVADLRVRSLAFSRMQNLRRVDKNSWFCFKPFETEVHEILGHCRRPFVVSISRLQLRLSISCFTPRILAVKLLNRRTTSRIRGFRVPIFRGKHTPNFGQEFSNRTHFKHMAAFG